MTVCPVVALEAGGFGLVEGVGDRERGSGSGVADGVVGFVYLAIEWVVWFVFVVVFGPEVGRLGFVFEFVVVVHSLTRRSFG